MDTDIHKTVFVPWMPQEAFHLFVNCIGEWWPLDTHSLADKQKGERATNIVIEPHAGSPFYEVLADGQHKKWGDVLRYKQGEDLLLSWRLCGPVAQETEVEVIFSTAGAQTKIDLFHRHFKRFGEKAAEKQDCYDKGWDGVLAKFISFSKTHLAA
ncbi:MAG: hypothetical protein V4691_02425 [Pseudomonadota bacterium]